MAETVSQQILRRAAEASVLYHQLVLLVGPSGTGKTATSREVALQAGYPYFNVNLELSRRLLDLTERQRALKVPSLLEEIIRCNDNPVVLLDNLEILFDLHLKQNPLGCLQGLARHRTIVAAWNGTISGAKPHLATPTYATPDHPEYRRYPVGETLIVALPGLPRPRP